MELTLTDLVLTPPSGGAGYSGTPAVGLADLWGKSAGYRSVYDVIEETQALGPCRRIARIPDVELPCPVLMMHMDAVLFTDAGGNPDGSKLAAWLSPYLLDQWEPENEVGHWLSRPWQDYEGSRLGRVGCDTWVEHPYVHLYEAIRALKKKRKYSAFLAEFGLAEYPAVFGLTWFTYWARVLGPDETEDDMSQAEIEAGVIPAYTQDDPRAQEA
jgi:hypothetical protein